MTIRNPKAVLWTANEALAFNDLNHLRNSVHQRAWDWPGFGEVANFSHLVNGYTSSWYPVALGTPGKLRNIVFTKGHGLQMIGTSLAPGFLGIYSSDAAPDELGLAGAPGRMQWAFISATETITWGSIPTNGYGLLRARFVDIATDAATRHFRDAATGALSSSSTSKRFTGQLEFSVKITAGIPTYSDLTDGGTDWALVAIRHNPASGGPYLYDCTVPLGRPRVETHLARNLDISDGILSIPEGPGYYWGPDGNANAFCQLRMQDPGRRLLRLDIRHNLTGTPQVLARQFNQSTDTYRTKTEDTDAVAITLTGGPDFAVDIGPHWSTFNFMGPCFDGLMPAWGQGRTRKEDWTSADALQLCLAVKGGTSGLVQEFRVWTVEA